MKKLNILGLFLGVLFRMNEATNVPCTVQTGLQYIPVPSSPVNVGSGGASSQPVYKLLSCCKSTTYSSTSYGMFEFPGGTMDLEILCATSENGTKISIKNFHCQPSGALHYAEFDPEKVTYPLKIRINGPRFKFYAGGEKFMVKFLVHNTEDGKCKCPASCASGWLKFSNYCYKNNSSPAAFHAMDNACAGFYPGGTLASIHSTAQNNFIKNNFGPSMSNLYWIGLHELKVNGVNTGWSWTDCTPYDYKPWRQGQPDNWKGIEDCGHRYKTGPFINGWNDINCATLMSGVCQYYLP